MTWDRFEGEPHVPERGDLVYGPIALYEVLDVRPVESRSHPDRWMLTVRRLVNDTGNLDELARRPDARLHATRFLNTSRALRDRRRIADGLQATT